MGSARSTKSALMRRKTLTRSMSGVAAQPGWAAPAAATARSTSAGAHRAISFTSSPEYGFRTSNVPALPSTHRPPMRASRGSADAVSTAIAMSISSLGRYPGHILERRLEDVGDARHAGNDQ